MLISDGQIHFCNIFVRMNRWEQRFENFNSAFLELERALTIKQMRFVELAGTIKLYELAFKLSWKVIKDYLEDIEKYPTLGSPRSVIFAANEIRLLNEADSELWISALESRNSLAHTYNETLAKEGEWKFRNQFYPMLSQFKRQFQDLK
jgi:nucleotidyltransferase substrate binding protein (TIGR01987 family)